MTYAVYAKDNSGAGANEAERKVEDCQDCEAAIAACKRIVERSLEECGPSKSAEEIFDQYTLWGEDAWIVTVDPDCKFSAWDYARQRCSELAAQRSATV